MTEPQAAHAHSLDEFLSQARVLIVDDNERNRMLIGALLTAAGVNNQETAVDGIDALDKVESFSPDLIVLDIMMPRMDGMEFMQILRSSTEQGTVPILVQTALNSPEERNKIYASGATDMLSKPINTAELITRVRTHLELRHLAQVYQDQMRLEAELGAARRMQEALLPPQTLLDEIRTERRVAIDAHFETSSELGGDIWGTHILGDGMTGVYSVDFSGHGVGASLNTFRLHALMSHMRPLNADVSGYLADLNNDLNELLPLGQYATMFYAVIDTNSDTLTYSAAAAPSVIMGKLDGSGVAYHTTRGVPLGMKQGSQYDTYQLPFRAGDFLFLYSDALIETADEFGDVINETQLLRMVEDAVKDREGIPVIDALRAAFEARSVGPLGDDLTLVMVSR
ncbi:fused response regulator/phosphatase [Magnetovibrio sp. PR-2]|uniref:PP2C family protein-serine/threonine phosphatase n=1 Tax=Magnetovibrio sp. PR-2 TaxID=3120356 RepID=UPI002FCDF0EF